MRTRGKGRCPDTHRITTLRYRWVVSRGGQRIGILDDLYLDETGGITAYAIEHTECGGILRRHCRFAHQERVTLGTDALIVPDAVAEAADLDTRDEREPA